MIEELTFRGYRPGDEEAILETFNVVFREVCGESFVDRNIEFWRWQFEANPGGHRISLAVAPDGTIAAQYAGVVYSMATSYGDCNFVHIVDSMAHPDYRKGLKKPGLFVTTAYPWFEDCYAQGDAVLYGYPVPIAERIGQRYLEYKRLRVVDYLCRDLNAVDGASPGSVTVELLEGFGAEVDLLFERVAREKHCLTRRDANYLDWRWRSIPGDDYEILAARRDGDLCGLAVLRPEHELVPNSCSIADWVVPEEDTETADALVNRAAERGREGGRDTLMTVFPDPSPEYAHMCAAGFEAVPSKTYMERRLTHRIYHPEMTTEWLEQNWWYTLGDSDLV